MPLPVDQDKTTIKILKESLEESKIMNAALGRKIMAFEDDIRSINLEKKLLHSLIPKWLAVDIAPTDGTVILVYHPKWGGKKRPMTAKYNDKGYWQLAHEDYEDCESLNFKYWMHLPKIL